LSDLITNRKAETERLQAQMEKIKDAWTTSFEKQHQLHDFHIRNLERKLYAMSIDELSAYADSYLNGKVHFLSPMENDALAAILKDRGLDEENENVRAMMLELNYDSPWLVTPEGSAVDTQLRLNQHIDGSGGILLSDEQGRVFSSDFDEVADLLLPDENDEEAQNAQ
jgi:hypothetical protein